MEARALEIFHLDDMVIGMVVGDFSPAALRTEAAEVAVNKVQGRRPRSHSPSQSCDRKVTLVLEGTVEMRADAAWVMAISSKLTPGEATDLYRNYP